VHCIRTIATHCPPPRKGAGGGAERAGRWGCFHEYRSTGDTQRQGRGMFHPPPRRPLPQGGDSPSTQFQGRDPLSAVSVNTLLKSCLCPRALYPDYRHALPAPSEGGGRRRGTRRAVGVFPRIPFNQRHSDRRRGVPPPPRQPHPHGGDIPSTQFHGGDPLPAVSVNALPKSLPCSPCTAIQGQSRPGGGGGLPHTEKERLVETQETGAGDVPPPSPSAPPPGG